ncbi:2-C-methyl-D-erythritol 4-phosphate cytidylyltransferase [Svornostia abyssi]|uniref:2-C-methyl-D-erythritol 4-phosphate cytidylyltransferase n=1 Tax=Svornostia abyssi TaxID=2898438 RepID=A0ABY5PFB5_9ACTN|nr:2-C-methyl-D-erythritol 4-phosphate cytidylyltransferase [Parviterribacteraceae bacterium J379]
MTASALIVAAGRGERLGSDRPKAFAVLAGRPMLEWALDALRDSPQIGEIVVALPEGYDAPDGCIGVRGGAERSHSVRAALAASTGDPILVQDAARPMLTPEIVASCLAAVAQDGVDAAIAAAPVTDTIKEAAGGDVVRTLDRSVLWAVQTPQVFRRAALEAALSQPDEVLAAATDDASLVEAAGGTVRVVPTPASNLKVTTPHDLEIAELLLRSSTRNTP